MLAFPTSLLTLRYIEGPDQRADCGLDWPSDSPGFFACALLDPSNSAKTRDTRNRHIDLEG